MARFVAGVLAGMVISAAAGAALGIRAQEDDVAEEAPPLPAESIVTAIRIGIDARALHAAAHTAGVDVVTYSQSEGMLPRPSPPPQSRPPAEPALGVWDRLAVCESTSNWSANTGNGYYGGVQQDMVFWRRYGGTAFASRPDLASRAQQIVIAERGLAVQGWGAWPACSRRLGLR